MVFCWVAALGLAAALVCCSDRAETGSDAAQALTRSLRQLRLTVPSETPFVTVVTADKVDTLDPHNTESGGDVKALDQIYETLLRVDPTNADRLIPVLAESWAIAGDGLSIAFAIREGVVFHDGGELDGRAVKLSLARLRGEVLDVPAAPYRGYFEFIDHIDADGLKLTVHLKRPVARVALRNLSMFPAAVISPRLLEATEGMGPGQRTAFISEWASGTGPYFLADFDSGAVRVRLGAFGAHWGGAAAIKAVLFRRVQDPNNQIEHLRSGEADMMDDVPREVWEQLEADPKITLERHWALNICYLGLNVVHEKTSDVRLRRAIRLAIDPQQLGKLYYGTARPTYSLVAQPFAEYDPNYRAPGTGAPLEQRRRRARELLVEAGALGRSLKIYYPMDKRPYLPTPQKVADKLRQQLGQIDLHVDIVAVPNKELFESVRNNHYELILIGWMSDNADPDNFYMPLASGDPATGRPGPMNCGRVFDLEVHQALLHAQALADPQQRIDAYRAVERRLQEHIVGYVPLLNTQQGYAFGPRLWGVEIDPLGHYRFAGAELR